MVAGLVGLPGLRALGVESHAVDPAPIPRLRMVDSIVSEKQPSHLAVKTRRSCST